MPTKSIKMLTTYTKMPAKPRIMPEPQRIHNNANTVHEDSNKVQKNARIFRENANKVQENARAAPYPGQYSSCDLQGLMTRIIRSAVAFFAGACRSQTTNCSLNSVPGSPVMVSTPQP
jgi:cell division septation protein DedD